jgi:hypothetical protein
MSLVTKTIDSRILGKEMNLAVYRPAVNADALWRPHASGCHPCSSEFYEPVSVDL